MLSEGLVTLAFITAVAWIVWGIVVIRLAHLGAEHPKHKDYFVELAKSKKPSVPDITFGQFGRITRRSNDDKFNR
jgi:hypothetical protein